MKVDEGFLYNGTSGLEQLFPENDSGLFGVS